MKKDLLQKLTLEMEMSPGFTEGRSRVFHREFAAAQDELRVLLDNDASEHQLQALLERRPGLLLYVLLGGFYPVASPRSALFSKVKLGETHETDFAYVNTNSAGARWVLVEIEKSHAMMFTKAGDPAAAMTHAIRQITDWRSWIQDNRAYAEDALNGLLETTDLHRTLGTRLRDPSFYVIIGRRSALTADANRRRMMMCEQHRGLEIVTWDRLLDDYGVGFPAGGEEFGGTGPGPLGELPMDDKPG